MQEQAVDKTMLTSWLMQAGFNPPAISIAVGDGRRFLSRGWGGISGLLSMCLKIREAFLVNSVSRRRETMSHSLASTFVGLRVELEFFGILLWMECRPAFLPAATEQSSGDHAIVVADVLAAERSSEGR